MQLDIAVQPPTQTRPGVPLYPPVTACLSSQTDIYHELGQMWAVATLVDQQSGQVLEGRMDGRVFDSAHPLPKSASDIHSGSQPDNPSPMKDQAYFLFPDLTINEPGHYNVRVSLMEMGTGEVRVREAVDTRTIVVEDQADTRARANVKERGFLRVVKNDGGPVPSPPA